MPAVTWEDLLYPGEAMDFFAGVPPAFAPQLQSYSHGNAWWLAELSRLVYRCDAITGRHRAALERVQLRELDCFHSAALGTQALLVAGSTPQPFTLLAFRGTEQKLQDFLHDADARWTSIAGGAAQVHRGFERALNAIWEPIARALTSVSGPLFLTGHSLGAAQAILAATRCAPAPAAVYAFGAPRVGDANLATVLRGIAIWRVVHGDDIVTVVPPRGLGFRHVGEPVRIGTAVMRRATLDPRLLWSGFGHPAKPLADHAPIGYTRALAALCL